MTMGERGTGLPAGGAMPEAAALTANDIIAMLKRRMVLITVLFVLLGGAVFGGFAVWWVHFPGYSSESLIECISNIPQAELSAEQQRLRQDEHERFVLTQAQLIKSPAILGEALKLTAVRDTQWWKEVQNRGWKRPDEHLIQLGQQLVASPVRGTNFLRVAMECRRPDDAPVIVRAVVTHWYQSVRKKTAEDFAAPLEAGRKERDALDLEIRDARSQLGLIAGRLPPGARQNPAANVTNQEVAQYSAQGTQLELELAQLEQYRSAYNDPTGMAVTAEDRAAVEQDPQVMELARTLLLMEQQRAADSKVYGPGHREIRKWEAQIAAIQTQLDELRTQRLRERWTDFRELVNTSYESTRHALFLAREKQALAEAALQDQDRLLFEYTNLEAEIQQNLTYREQLAEYIRGLERVRAQQNAINVSIAQEPTQPLERSSPSILLIPIGLLFAMTVCLCAGVGLELLNTSVRTSQDIERYVNVAMLGVVPDTDDEEVTIRQIATAVRDAPRSMIAEAFRRIRSALVHSTPAERQRSVLITSPRPEDGKTTVACNLALAAAAGGLRVLLIDANLRRPAIHSLFPQARAGGLSDLLLGDGPLSSLVVASGAAGLDVLGAGKMPPNPAELLSTPRFRALLQEATASYDQVVLDAPPVLLASDATAAGTVCDGVILVVRAGRNSRGAARRAVQELRDNGAIVFGAVLNAAQAARGGYFREQLRAFYEYQEQAGGSTKQADSVRSSGSSKT
jgi:capsular exopolysaccharide synthesis family protein